MRQSSSLLGTSLSLSSRRRAFGRLSFIPSDTWPLPPRNGGEGFFRTTFDFMPAIPDTIGTSTFHAIGSVDDGHAGRSEILGLFPFTPSERFRIAHARAADELTWIADSHGEELASLVRHSLFPQSSICGGNIFRARNYLRRQLDELGLAGSLPSIPVDARTAILLAEQEAPAQETLAFLATLRRQIERGIRSVQIHRPGVSNGNGENLNVFVPDTIDADRATHLYLTSVPEGDGGTQGHERFQRLAGERKHAFALYKEILQTPSLSGLDQSDLYGILEVCFRLTNGQRPELVLTTGFGGSQEMPSARLPSYLTGALEWFDLFQRSRDEGVIAQLPRLRILLAPKLAGQINAMDQHQLDESAADAARLLSAFVHRFAPEAAGVLTVETDHHLAYPAPCEVADYFSSLRSDDPALGRILQQAERMMRKDRLASQGDAVAKVQQYVAAHVALFMDVVTPRWHGAMHEARRLPDIVWSVGGKGEAFFNHFRGRFRELLYDQADIDNYFPLSIRTLQKQGQHPPYYHLPGIDVDYRSLENSRVLPDGNGLVDKAARNSLQADRAGLMGIVRRQLAKERGMTPTDITEADIEAELGRFFRAQAAPLTTSESHGH
ncbi:MAG: hypothetical protein U1D30_06875 [Planctomycetota bacterium]